MKVLKLVCQIFHLLNLEGEHSLLTLIAYTDWKMEIVAIMSKVIYCVHFCGQCFDND